MLKQIKCIVGFHMNANGQYMKFKRIDMIDFGKYKGKSFEYVLNELEDYSYLVWINEIGKEVPNYIFNEAFKMYQNELITPSTNELLNGQFIFYTVLDN